MNKCKILVPIGCRSDEGISAPIIRRLNETDWCEVDIPCMVASDFFRTYEEVKDHFEIYEKPDLMLCVGDRVEMTAAACAAFHNNIPICHYGSGIINTPLSTFDDTNRHCITLWSDIQLCESYDAMTRTRYLVDTIKESNAHEVGITHLDDLIIDESLVPKEPYDLILYNPIISKEILIKEINQIKSMFKLQNIIWVNSNPDHFETKIEDVFTMNDYENVKRYHVDLPREQYIGLLKNCSRFISNSSDTYYIAPYFLKPEQIIMIGDRNKDRSTPKKLETGASDKIVKIIKEYWRKKNA